jgi:malonyl CoA-acyl carrier protein transacylase/acyl carrier protein
MGHLGPVAGIAGLLKTSLALKHKMLPPGLHYQQPNPQIDFANSPFYVNTQLTTWDTDALPRRAGVSAFGIGGTNAHVILEEAPEQHEGALVQCEAEDQSLTQDRRCSLCALCHRSARSLQSWEALILSAKTGSALEQMRVNLLEHLKEHPDLNLADLAFTLQVGRKAFPHRLMLVCQTVAEAVSQLEAKQCFLSVTPPVEQGVVFMFPGQGPQYVNMGRELYDEEPIFRQQVDTCAALLVPYLHRDLREVIYPPIGKEATAQDQLEHMLLAQPAIFVIEYALAQLWLQRGIRPAAMIGHSIGEYTAACLAGVLSLQDALFLVALRGRLMDQLENGAMLAVSLSEEEVLPLLGARLSMAAHNSMSDCVVSGPADDIGDLQRSLTEQEIPCQVLHVSRASHSQMLEPVLAQFTREVSKLRLHPPTLPYISNLTGQWITEQEVTDPEYWTRHWRQTVRFAEGIQLLLDVPATILLEVGPGRSLSTLAQRMADRHKAQSLPWLILSSLRHPQAPISDMAFLLNTCGQLWCAGVAIDWSQGAGTVGTGLAPVRIPTERRRRLSLPTYPFERERYWIFPVGARMGASPVPTALASREERSPLQMGKKANIADWFSAPSWKRSPLRTVQMSVEQSEHKGRWLIFTDSLVSVPSSGSRKDLDSSGLPPGKVYPPNPNGSSGNALGLGTRLVSRLRMQEETVITVTVGAQFSKISEREYTLRSECRADYDALLKDMDSRGLFPTNIVHLWTLIATDHVPSGLAYFETAQALGFYSLLFLTQALGEHNVGPCDTAAGAVSCTCPQPLQVAIVSNNLQEVIGGEVLCPVRATVLGIGKVAPHEYPHMAFRYIDVVLPEGIGQAQGKGARKGASPVPTPTPVGEERIIEQLVADLLAQPSDSMVAYRGPHRWVPCLEPALLEALQYPPTNRGNEESLTSSPASPDVGNSNRMIPNTSRSHRTGARHCPYSPDGFTPGQNHERLRQQGVYLITGGLGGIGLSLAEDLARRVKARLVLTGRTALPAREEWHDRLATACRDSALRLSEDDAIASKIRQVMMLEELGAQVLVVKADVTDLEQMQAVITQVHERFGALHGVIHAAGLSGGGLIQLKAPEVAARVLAPKVKGTLVLEAVLQDLHLDFVVLCSSLYSVIGGIGQVDYCAANSFLDSFAFYHTAKNGIQTISINWDGWQEVGMAVGVLAAYEKSSLSINKGHDQLNSKIREHLQYGILPQEGVEAFRRILSHAVLPQIIVSPRDIQLLRTGPLPLHLDLEDGSLALSRRQPRPHLQTAYVAPRNEMEQQIAAIWQKMLGIEHIGIQDNFFAAGGDSLMGLRTINELRKAFRVDLSLSLFLKETPTIEGIAKVIRQKQMELIDDEQLAEILQNVSQMSEEEALQLLEKNSSEPEGER